MKALFLDLYDTIARTEWPAALGGLAARLGVGVDALLRGFEATRAERGTGRCGSVTGDLRAVAAACGLAPDDRLLAGLALDVVTGMQRSVRLYDDVLPVVRTLRSAGTRVAVISNCDHATRPVVDGLGLEAEVDAVVLSCEVGSLKPDEPIFREAMRRLRSAARDSVFVDDQDRYLDGAARLGMRTFRMVRAGMRADTPEPGTHPVISSLAPLLQEDTLRPTR